MIYTVTLNPAIDKTVEIPGFTAGKVNRIQNLRVDAGGKGIIVTKCLTNLGTDSTAAMLVGGSSGKNIQQMLAEQNIRTLAVSVSGETTMHRHLTWIAFTWMLLPTTHLQRLQP